MELKDKIVIVTGSSTGLGRAIAVRFGEEKARVVVNYLACQSGAEETAEKIKSVGGQALVVQGDVSNPVDIERLFSLVCGTWGTVDILINNAAIGTDKVPFMEASHADLFEMVNTDLIGPMVCCQHAVRIMEKQGYGKILFTSSIRGAEHGGRAIAYAASKAGINSLAKTLAKQVAPDIQVNAVAPGFVRTRWAKKMTDEQLSTLVNQTYLKRWIEPEEIAEAFIFLAKNDAITGQVLYVDGGFTLK